VFVESEEKGEASHYLVTLGSDGEIVQEATVPAIDGYEVQYTVEFANLTPDTSYKAKVYAVNNAGTSKDRYKRFETMKAISSPPPPSPTPPPPPPIEDVPQRCAFVTVEDVTASSSTVTWGAAPRATSYLVRIGTGGNTVLEFTATDTDFDYEAAGLEPATNYKATVWGVNEFGRGPPVWKRFTTNGAPPPPSPQVPSPPSSVDVEDVEDNYFTLTWTYEEEEDTYPAEYFKVVVGSEGETVFETTVIIESWYLTNRWSLSLGHEIPNSLNVTPSTNYKCKVYSCNDAGCSDSNYQRITTPASN
jgi:hypothetical protein